ncbi:hypothetical protein GOP47_0006512 [Adiantum capillus-veneris]|uniref:Uncharacterized protein n=1 Tax=Adiantum capillus-veneris TaxID=13818 RepID=A0A9D4V310_ADICA|nr:hypothetical protein GOP47_0006512 [Adiantum capillus-veneris]
MLDIAAFFHSGKKALAAISLGEAGGSSNKTWSEKLNSKSEESLLMEELLLTRTCCCSFDVGRVIVICPAMGW